MMYSVEIENVTKTFGRVVAVDDLSLKVPEGTIYGFIGPNGSGKTTTLRMIMNIFYPDKGVIHVLGNHLTGGATDRIGYMPEERGLYKKMKVRDILRFYGALKNGKHIKQEVDRWLEKLDLRDWANKKVEALSKGMSQKVQFIATVIARPELIILDEPFSGLDPVNSDILTSAILELREAGSTIIFSTHDMAMAEKMCDFIFMIYQGRKVLDGTLNDIQDTYGSDVIRIRTQNTSADLNGLQGVEKINNYGQIKELRIAAGADPQTILTTLLQKTRLLSFEVAKPSLHDIFVRIAAPDKEGNNHA
jgi:ABC-2 type transport system ATP-binding protein